MHSTMKQIAIYTSKAAMLCKILRVPRNIEFLLIGLDQVWGTTSPL